MSLFSIVTWHLMFQAKFIHLVFPQCAPNFIKRSLGGQIQKSVNNYPTGWAALRISAKLYNCLM